MCQRFWQYEPEDEDFDTSEQKKPEFDKTANTQDVAREVQSFVWLDKRVLQEKIADIYFQAFKEY